MLCPKSLPLRTFFALICSCGCLASNGQFVAGQESSSRRSGEDVAEVDFPLNEPKVSLLDKMTKDTGPATKSHKIEAVVKENQISKNTGFYRKESQYPVYRPRTASESDTLNVTVQKPLRVSYPDGRNNRRSRFANRSRNVSKSRNQAAKAKPGNSNNNRPQNAKSINAVVEQPRLFSVLESKSQIDSPSIQITRQPTSIKSGNSVLNRPVGETVRASESKTMENEIVDRKPLERRATNILLGKRSVEESEWRSEDSEPQKPNDNIFRSRDENTAQSNEARRPAYIARRDAIYENLKDHESKSNSRRRRQDHPENIPDRLRFQKPNATNSEQSLGHDKTNGSQKWTDEDQKQLEDMEFEDIIQKTTQPAEMERPAKPSDFWLNKSSRYNFSPIKRSTIREKVQQNGFKDHAIEPKNLAEHNQIQKNTRGIQILFSDQPEYQELVDPDPSSVLGQLEPTLVDDENDSELEIGIDDEESDDERKSELELEEQRAAYRADLHGRLTNSPAQRAITFLNDEGKTIPHSLEQRLYLDGFAGFYTIADFGSTSRLNTDCTHWSPKCAVWASPNVCYKALYYEDVNLERYGARFPFWQPGLSAVHFFGSTIRLPYMMALDPLHECQFSAGYGRPGNSYCYQKEQMVWSLRAGSFQALLTTAVVFALP